MTNPSTNALFEDNGTPSFDKYRYNARPTKKYPAGSLNIEEPYASIGVEVK